MLFRSEDIEKDIKKNNYNVFISLYQELANEPKMFSDHVRDILTMMMTEAASEFEKLPIVSYVDILRNILYSGVWVKFQIITNNRMGINKRKNNDG